MLIESANRKDNKSIDDLLAYPENNWRRLLFRLPVHLWRLGLGPLIGRVLMIITHTGRKSGLPRRTMVEYHRLNGTIYAPCVFGPRSDWYKNIAANPRVTIQTAGGSSSMTANRVTADTELLAVYALFRRRDPPLLKWYLRSLDIEDEEEDVLRKKERIYWLRFDPTNEPTPPQLGVDLVWVWPVLLITLVVVWLLKKR